MTTQKQNLETTAGDVPADNVITHIGAEAQGTGKARDINTKIDFLDGSLEKLNTELEIIRHSVEEGLDRLGDNELDLTAKVSDTYKRLGELDNTYKSLINISSDINHEIQKLTGNISEVATHSSAELSKLEATTDVHNTYLSKQNGLIVERVNHLVTESQKTTSSVYLSISEVRETLLVAEHKLVTEIGVLASSSQKDHEVLSKELNVSNIAIESSKARIIKLEKVDEAIVRRAGQLEISSAELTVKSKELDESVSFLGERTSNLSSTILDLVKHTETLKQASEKQGSMISSIQKTIASHAQNIFDLGNNERNHFRITMLSLLLIVVAVFAFYNYQTNDNEQAALLFTEQAQSVDSTINALNTTLQQELLVNEALADEVDVLNAKLSLVNKNIQDLGDQAQSLDGRLNTVLPFDNFGGDNIVHGSQWLAQLSADKFIIQIAHVTNKQELYEIAQDYSRYLTQPVAYYTDVNGHYVMFYGEFDSGNAAYAVLRSMPSRINWQRPVVVSVANVQKLIAL